MPVPTPPRASLDVFPLLSRADIDAARTSAWTATRRLRRAGVPAVVLDLEELGEKQEFLDWLAADSIFMPSAEPKGASISVVEEEDSCARTRRLSTSSSSSASSSSSTSSADTPARTFHLPRLISAIAETLQRLGGSAFPKLNWTAPQDAAFILPQTDGPLRCYSPDDIFLLLKSSDIIQHDLDPSRAYASGRTETFEGAVEGEDEGVNASTPSSPDAEAPGDVGSMRVELVLKAYAQVNPSNELRCFVRDNVLVGVSQRDTNFYEHLQEQDTRNTICETIREFWEDEVRDVYTGGTSYVLDLYLSSTLDRAFLIDINPYRPTTDPLLFTYPELLDILLASRSSASAPPPAPATSLSAAAPTPPTDSAESSPARLPVLRVIDSRAHPAANRVAPAHGTNMMPIEMVQLSQGRSVGEFAEALEQAMAAGMRMQ